MRKAFDANVPKLKPRLRTAVVVVSEDAPETHDERTLRFKKALPSKAVAFAPVKESKQERETVPEPVSTEKPSLSPVEDTTPEPETASEMQSKKSPEQPAEKEVAAAAPQIEASSRSAAPASPKSKL